MQHRRHFTPNQLTSHIVQLNNTIVNLPPNPLLIHPPLPPSLHSSTNEQHSTQGCGWGPPLAQNRAHPPDHSTTYCCGASTSPFSLHSNTSHKYYTIINRVGSIAVANVYSIDFDNDSIYTMIAHVPFNQHKLFTTHQEAWTFFIAFPQ